MDPAERLAASKSNSILLVSSNQSTSFLIKELALKCGYSIRIITGLKHLLLLEADYRPSIVIIESSENLQDQQLIEMMSVLDRQLPNTHALIIYNHNISLNASELFRAGAKGIYQFPYEEQLLIDSIFENAPIDIPTSSLAPEVMTEVRILELRVAENLPFDVFIYLPQNCKFLLYRRKDHQLDRETIEKFETKNINSFYIRKSDLKLYHNYTAQVLSKINDSNLTRIERTHKLKNEVKNLISSFFTKDKFSPIESQSFLNTLNKVMQEYIGRSRNDCLFQRISDLACQSFTNYGHCMNTATYAVIFGMLTGFEELEILGLGGLLHDIGLSELPPSSINIPLSRMSPDQIQQYKTHPLRSVDIIRRKSLPIPEMVISMIEQHHENPDGSGYPNGLTLKEITPYAQILALADHLDELTSQSQGKATLSPHDALRTIMGSDSHPPAPFYNEELHGPIIRCLLNPNDENLPDAQKEAFLWKE